MKVQPHRGVDNPSNDAIQSSSETVITGLLELIIRSIKPRAKWVCLLGLACATQTLASEQDWNYSVGFSLKQLSLDVYRKGRTDPEGTLTEGFFLVPVLGVDSKINYFSDSAWGYQWVMNFGGFEMTDQDVNYQEVNLGTSSKGYYLYAMPVAIYDFKKGQDHGAMLVGLGVGVGYLKARGDIIFTESSPQSTHEFDLSKGTFSFGLFFERQLDDWSYGVSIYGPEVPRDGFEYNLFDIGFNLRKKFTF